MGIFEKIYIRFKIYLHQILTVTFGFTSRCKHSPTCSRYMIKAIKKEGLRGFKKGFIRIINCH